MKHAVYQVSRNIDDDLNVPEACVSSQQGHFVLARYYKSLFFSPPCKLFQKLVVFSDSSVRKDLRQVTEEHAAVAGET